MPGSSACSAVQALDQSQILTSFHCRNFGQVKRDPKNEPEVTTTEKYCVTLRLLAQGSESQAASGLQAAPQKHCSSCIIWSSAVTTPHSSINAVGKLILSAYAGKCRAGVLSEHQPTALGIIKQWVLYHTRIFFKQSFKINSLIKTCASVFLTELWGNKMITPPSYPQTPPTCTPPNDFLPEQMQLWCFLYWSIPVCIWEA